MRVIISPNFNETFPWFLTFQKPLRVYIFNPLRASDAYMRPLNKAIIGSENESWPDRHQVIIWPNDCIFQFHS